ncbi:hypothetical protein, partial [Nostoc sp.]|uniref:hypothetical protein n=1 Tax=Nostoc sp. TaxID=1180 RepID=UPI002FF8132A
QCGSACRSYFCVKKLSDVLLPQNVSILEMSIAPLPASGEGRQSVALAGVGFFGFNKQSSGNDLIGFLVDK